MKDCWILTSSTGEPILPESVDDCPHITKGFVMVAFTDKRDAEYVRDRYNAEGFNWDIRLLSEIQE